jgi:2-O-methyltransferase
MKLKKFFSFTLIFLSLSFSTIKTAGLPKEFIAQFLPNNPVIVEAGAYDGGDTIEMSRLWPQGTIYAFEPIPNIFKILASNTHHCKNVVCIEKALSNAIGFHEMYVSTSYLGGGDASSSLLQPAPLLKYYFPQISFHDKVIVETITLDKWAEDMKIDHIDFLWFDLQGMEPFVLQASPKIFKTVKVIQTEVSYTKLYEQAPLYSEFRAWLEEQGFVAIQEYVAHPSWGDVLFVRKDH